MLAVRSFDEGDLSIDAFFYAVDTALSLKEQSRFLSVAMCHFAPCDAYCGFFLCYWEMVSCLRTLLFLHTAH